jgi:hypothetical protein
MKRILLIALFTVSILVLLRTMMGIPIIKRIQESFQSGGSQVQFLNSATECPVGTEMYMYEGGAYCCGGGKVNRDADTVEKTCRPIPMKPAPTFCTLGPSQEKVKNCLELKAGLLQAEGETTCPPSKPNFCKGPAGSATANGRCCSGPVNAEGTDCADSNAFFQCTVGTDPNELKDMNDCRFQREKETQDPCPPKYFPFSSEGQGPLKGVNVYGCSDLGKNCYSKAVIARLKELGYDSSSMPVCSSA